MINEQHKLRMTLSKQDQKISIREQERRRNVSKKIEMNKVSKT